VKEHVDDSRDGYIHGSGFPRTKSHESRLQPPVLKNKKASEKKSENPSNDSKEQEKTS
jgi:hypothetical protein